MSKAELTPYEERAVRKFLKMQNKEAIDLSVANVIEDEFGHIGVERKPTKFPNNEYEDLFNAIKKLMEATNE